MSELRSPGRATSERAALENAIVAQMTKALDKFLAQVEKDAIAALSLPVLLAAGQDDDELEPFSLGKVLASWVGVVDVMSIALVKLLAPSKDHLAAMARRVANSPLPGQAFTSVRETLAATAGKTRAEVIKALRSTLRPDTGETIRDGDQKPVTAGVNWEAQARRIARTEATAAYGSSQLSALAQEGFASKTWVAHHDKITRPSHAQASGQSVPLDAPFMVGGFALMFPADDNGPIQETANCRCVIVGGQGEDPAGPLTIRTHGGQDLEPGAPLSHADTLSGANPRFEYDEQATINCQKTVAAYEMRRRGYKVVAMPGQGGKMHTDGLFSWFKDSGKESKVLNMSGRTAASEKYNKIHDSIDAAYPNDARGVVWVDWTAGGGHVFSWEKVGHRRVVFMDAQTNENYSKLDETWAAIDHRTTVVISRLDDKDFLPEGSKALTVTTEAIGKPGIAGQQSLWSNLRALEDDMAQSKARMAAHKRLWDTKLEREGRKRFNAAEGVQRKAEVAALKAEQAALREEMIQTRMRLDGRLEMKPVKVSTAIPPSPRADELGEMTARLARLERKVTIHRTPELDAEIADLKARIKVTDPPPITSTNTIDDLLDNLALRERQLARNDNPDLRRVQIESLKARIAIKQGGMPASSNPVVMSNERYETLIRSLPQFDEEDLRLIDDYVSSGYYQINDMLRQGTLTPKTWRVRDQINTVDDLVDRRGYDLPTDLVVYRGVDADPGGDFFDAGFASTSVDAVKAKEFGDRVLTMELPKDTRVLPGSMAEHEFIVPRGSTWKMIGPDHYRLVTVKSEPLPT